MLLLYLWSWFQDTESRYWNQFFDSWRLHLRRHILAAWCDEYVMIHYNRNNNAYCRAVNAEMFHTIEHNPVWTRSTRRAQTSLAEADHYSYISQCDNVEPWWWKANPKGFGSLPAPRSGYATTIMVFFCSFTHFRIPEHHQNLISSSLYYPGPLHKISSQSVHKCLSNVVHRQTDKRTNQRYQKHNLLCQGGNKYTLIHKKPILLFTIWNSHLHL